MTKVITYVEIDIDYCSLTYGTAPCTAAVPTTGADKCFNTQATCQDSVNFTNSPLTLRFAIDSGYLPDTIDCIPCLVSVQHTPSVVSLGENLGMRASVSCTFKDHRHSDSGLDKYVSGRAYDAFKQGTFWGKFRARVPYLRGRSLRLIRGTTAQSLSAMDTRHFIIESYSGPNTNGEFTIVAKDALKLADDDRAVAPAPGVGTITGALTETSHSLTLTPGGVGDLEYGQSGFVAVGGKEVCQYTRDAGINTDTLLLLHCDGADASTTFTDSSGFARTVTVSGNAQIDTAQQKFGTASGLFDGTGDFLNLNGSADFAFGTSDFTIDMWVRRVGGGVSQGLFSTAPNATSGLYLDLGISAANVLFYFTNSANRIVGTTVVTTGAWHHVALVRSNGITRLYLDGIQEGADYADSNVYLNGANRPTIAAFGTSTTTGFNGWVDEVRVSKVARWLANFLVPTAAYAATGTDVLTITRAQKQTTAATHSAGSRAQAIKVYQGVDPADIVYDLLVNYASVDPALIPLSSWKVETAAYLQRVYTAYIAEPVGVNALISEIIAQAALSIWWDEKSKLIKLQVLRDLSSSSTQITEDVYVSRSLQIVEQPDKRVSQVWVYYAQRNPLKRVDDVENYESILVDVDLQTESFYGSPAIRRLYSRWIATGGQSAAQRVGDILLARYKNPPRKMALSLLRDTFAGLDIGVGYEVSSWALQQANGAAEFVPIQLTSIDTDAALTSAIGEEIRFSGLTLDDPNTRNIVITSDTNNVNLRTLHDSLFPVITVPTGITVKLTIAEGATIGSSSATTPALDIGSWVAALAIEVTVVGRIQGKGGAGGSSPGLNDGIAGGTAIYTRYPITLKPNAGEVWGGGGGGGAGNLSGGGGGAGHDVGAKGTGVNPAYDGTAGTHDVGGTGGTGFVPSGGAGGGPGLAGSNTTLPATGGAAGKAIDGISYVTVSGGAGDRRGPEVN